MKPIKQPLSPNLFLALFALVCLILSGAVIVLRLPEVVLLVALGGVVYPAYKYPDRFYLIALTLYTILLFVVAAMLGALTPLFGFQFICVVAGALVLDEALYRFMVQMNRREAALIENQVGLEEAQSIAHVGHFTRDYVSSKAQWSREMYTIYGLDPAAGPPTTTAWEAMQHPEDRANVLETQRRATELGELIDIDHRIIRPDGKLRYLHTSGYLKPSTTGGRPILMGTVADITERTLAQQALRESEERVSTLIESAPISIIIVDEAGIIVQANPQVEVVFGYKPDELVGKPLDILIPSGARPVHLAHVRDYMVNPSVRLIGHKRELDAVGKGGATFPVEIGLNTMTIKGQTFGIAWIADITERRRAEDALRQSEQYFKLLHETGRDLSMTLDLEAIHESSIRAISQVMECDGLIISSYSSDEGMIRAVYAHLEGVTVDAGELLAPIPLKSLGRDPQCAVIRSGESLIIADYKENLAGASTAFGEFHAALMSHNETPGQGPEIRSTALVPLKLDNEVVGVLQVLSYQRDAFSEHHLHFLESLAAHIVLARKNALLFQQAQQELAERKLAEQALQLSEERYRAVSDLTSDYAYSFRVGPKSERTLEWVAGAFVQITGYTLNELAGIGGWSRLLLRQDVPAARRHTRTLLANQADVSEFRIVTREGGVRWLRDYARPVWDPAEGRVVRIIGAAEDITERRRAEDALIESEKLYRSVFEGTSVGLGIVDMDGRILAYNDAIIRPGGYTRADLGAVETVGALFYRSAEHIRYLRRLRKDGSLTREPVQFKRKDGTPYDTLLTLIPISLQGKPALHVIVEDLTEQKRIESEIRRLFAAQEHHLAELEALRRVTLDITSQLDLKSLLERLVADAVGLLKVESGAIYLYHPERDTIDLEFEFGTQPHLIGTRLKRGEGLSGRVLESGKPLMIDDYSKWEGRASVYEGQRFGAMLGVPIIWGNQMLGVIDAISTTPGVVFKHEDAGLLARFADQAAIAIHNARLYETEQKARMVAEILYATSVALTQSFDIGERLRVFLKNLRTLVPYDSANVMLIEPDGRLRVHAEVGYDEPSRAPRPVGSTYELSQLAGAREVIETLRTIHIADTSDYAGWVTFSEPSSIASWIGVPLIADSEVIGLYCLDKTVPNFFTEEHRYAAETLAAPAAIAIQNARLFESETRQLKLAQTLQKVGALLTTQMQLDEVFEHIFDLLAEVVKFDSVSVFLMDESGQASLGAQRAIPDIDRLVRGVQALARQPDRASSWNMAEALMINDTQTHEEWILPEGMEHVRAWIGAPLLVRGRRIGVLNVDSSKVNAFDSGMVQTVAAFANQAAVAIENARLYAQSANRSFRLGLLNEITRIGTETLDLPSLLERIVKIAARLIGGDSAAITLWDEKERLTTVAAISGGPGQPFGSIKLTAGLQELTATALREGHPLAIEDYYPHAAGSGVSPDGVAASSLLLPLQVGQLNLGALFIDFLSPHHFSDDEIAWSSQAAELIALAVAKAEVYENLERRVEQRTAELQAANDRLVALTKLKDEFVSNVSHELRTPIASIKLYHSLVAMRPDKQEAYLDHLHRETKRLENIVEGLLYLSRLDADRIELNMEQIDLVQIAEQFVADRRLLAEERGLTLSLVSGRRPDPVTGDPALLGQAISVLFTNALNYTPRGGRISIETEAAQRDGRDGAAFNIQDTGPGIPPDEMPRLFERFFRGAASRSPNVPGTGLGLAIAHEIVERHGGRLEVSSTGRPGEGTCFTIWLPGDQAGQGNGTAR